MQNTVLGHQGYFQIIGTEISRLVYLTIWLIPLLLANVGDVMVVMVTCLLEKNDGGLQNFCKVFFFLVFILLLLKAYTKVSRKQ